LPRATGGLFFLGRITVVDTGIGVTPEHMGKLFQELSQVLFFHASKYDSVRRE
jgi:hypothetical protein